MTNFIKVTAISCNQQGIESKMSPRADLQLNPSLISAIQGQDIHLLSGNVLNLSGHFYTKIKLA